MGATSATKAWNIMANVETVLAIEMMCAAQAIDFRLPRKPGQGPRIAHRAVREVIDHADVDRLFGDDIRQSLTLLTSGSILGRIEAEMGEIS
jgi:histidine ammonia-lyase